MKRGVGTLQISCLPVSLFGQIEQREISLPQWLREAKRIGYDGADISLMMIKNHTAGYLSELKREIKDAGIPLVMATTYPDFTNPDRWQRERELVYLKRDICLCNELTIPYLRVLAGQAHPGIQRNEGVRRAVSGLIEADEFAAHYGVKLLYENHAKPGAWQYVDFSYPVGIFLEIWQQLQNTGIRLNFDIGNLVSLGVDPISILEKVYEGVETMHVSDMAEWGTFCPTVIGEGVSPVREVLTWLRMHGMNPWLCIEEASGTGMAGIERAYQYVRGILEEETV